MVTTPRRTTSLLSSAANGSGHDERPALPSEALGAIRDLTRAVQALTERLDRQGKPAPEPELIDCKEFARLRGVGESTLRRHMARDLVGPQPVRSTEGGAVRFRRQEVLAWITAGCPDRERWQAIKQRENRGAGRPA